MRKFILLSLTIMISMTALAQSKTSQLNGTLITLEQKDTVGVVGAAIELTSLRDTLDKKYTISAIRGAYQFKGIPAGEYRMTATSLGYKTAVQEIKVTGEKTMTIPAWFIEEDNLKIEEVSVVTQAVRTTINGDTIVYNASAYKVLPDADADELLAKMPGIKVDGGTVEAQGETVQKILIDGREFFGNDVATAIKTLPAEAVKSIEVFDKLSDEAEFSGIDDGNSYKAINIVTHNKMKTAIFGKMNAQYAFEPRSYEETQHYGSIDGNLNFFREKSKTTVRFRANNMNGNAESKMGMGGLNYINSWGDKDAIKLEGSYTFNANNNKHKSWTERDYFLTEEELNSPNPDEIYEHYESNSRNQNKSYNHNFNSRFEWRISQRQRLMLRAQVSFNDNSGNNNSSSDYYPISGIDYITLQNWGHSNSDGLNANINGNYFLRLGEKAGRVLNINFNANYSDNNSGSENYSEKKVNEPIQQRSTSDNQNYRVNGNITYAEPLGERAQITVGYNANYSDSNADRLTHLYDFENHIYQEQISPEYSNRNATTYFTQRIGPGFRFSNDGTTISGMLNYQHVAMNSERVYPAVFVLPRKTFQDLTYSVMTRIKLNMENRISLRVSSNTSNPSVNQLQDVVDISNVNHISAGNPNLKPSYSHRANFNYTHSGIERGTTFSINFGGSKVQRAIVNSIIKNQPGYPIYSADGKELLTTLSPTGQFSKPVNINGDWSYNGGLSYGFPLNFIGCNFNIDAHGSYSQQPSLINDILNKSKRYTLGGGVMLGSNFSEYVDFRFRYSPNYNNVRNTMSTNGDNEYIQHNLNGNIRVVFGFGLTLHANGNYFKYVGLNSTAQNLNREELICNFGIGMKVLKKLGEVQLIANDVFNQNEGFNRSWNSQFMQNSTSSVIGRYYGIRFSYNLRHYGRTRKGKVIDDSRHRDSEGGFMPGGMGGHGGGGFGGGGFGGGGGFRGGF